MKMDNGKEITRGKRGSLANGKSLTLPATCRECQVQVFVAIRISVQENQEVVVSLAEQAIQYQQSSVGVCIGFVYNTNPDARYYLS